MPVMTQIADDNPLKIAWDQYQQSEEYANTRKWAAIDEHRDGSLWAAFMTGWQMADMYFAAPPGESKP